MTADRVKAGVGLAPVALYLHIPFCISLCPYCDFVVYAGAAAHGPRNKIASFVAALVTELELRADALDATYGPPEDRGRLETVFLGGGTPSLLPGEVVAKLLERVRDRYGLAQGAEVTLEANPGPEDRGDAAAFAAAGVTRMSYGAQSLQAAELAQLGRRHRPEDVGEAVLEARDGGIRSVSLDLLYDVPGQSLTSWAATLDAALALRPDHLSLYALTLDDPDAEGLTGPAGDHLPTSAGARRWRERNASRQDEDRAAAEYAFADEILVRAGFRGYELSNWARSGHESRHNLVYWTRRPYEAVGPGAHAFDGMVRRWNGARLDSYLAALNPGHPDGPTLPSGGQELIGPETAAIEELILGLRLDRGVPLERAIDPQFAEAFEWALRAGLVQESNDRRVRLTLRGRLLSNELFSRFV